MQRWKECPVCKKNRTKKSNPGCRECGGQGGKMIKKEKQGKHEK